MHIMLWGRSTVKARYIMENGSAFRLLEPILLLPCHCHKEISKMTSSAQGPLCSKIQRDSASAENVIIEKLGRPGRILLGLCSAGRNSNYRRRKHESFNAALQVEAALQTMRAWFRNTEQTAVVSAPSRAVEVGNPPPFERPSLPSCDPRPNQLFVHSAFG